MIRTVKSDKKKTITGGFVTSIVLFHDNPDGVINIQNSVHVWADIANEDEAKGRAVDLAVKELPLHVINTVLVLPIILTLTVEEAPHDPTTC